MHWTRHSVMEAVEANPRRVPTHSPPTSHSCPEASSARQLRTSNTDDISIASVVCALHWASLIEGNIFLWGQVQMTSGLREFNGYGFKSVVVRKVAWSQSQMLTRGGVSTL